MSQFSKRDTNVIKGIAILMLINYHCFSSEERLSGYTVSFLFSDAMHFAKLCDMCVAMFVFLSVFGICRGLPKGNPFRDAEFDKKYLVHRFTKLYLMYWPIVLICMAVSYAIGIHYYRTCDAPFLVFIQDLFGWFGFVYDGGSLCATWWYMSLAFVIVLLIPVYRYLGEKPGLKLTLLTFIVLVVSGAKAWVLTQNLLLIPFGMYCADHQVPERIRDFRLLPQKWMDDLIKITAFGLLAYFAADFAMDTDHVENVWRFIMHPMGGFCCVMFVYLTFARIAGLNSILAFLGKYSMNIFLVHTLIRSRWLGDFTYSLGKGWLIYLWVLAVSLVISIAVEKGKILVHYSKFEKFVENKILLLLHYEEPKKSEAGIE